MANSTQVVIDRAIAAISSNTSVVSSAIALMDALTALVRDNLEDPTALSAALDTFEAEKQALADAVARNTPAAPTP
jgi:uncharacterized phosphosugar-binding protein